MSSKGVDSLSNSDRINLLKQRLAGNDNIDSNTSNQQHDQSSIHTIPSEQLKFHRPPSEFIVEQQTPCKISKDIQRSIKSVEEHKKIDEIAIRSQVEKELREEYEGKFSRIKDCLVEYVSKYTVLNEEMKSIEMIQQQQKLGNINTYLNGTARWHGGIDVMRTEREIENINQKIKEIDDIKKEKGNNTQNLQAKKSVLTTSLKENKQKLHQLEEERKRFAYQIRFENDKSLSEFRPTQYLDEGKYLLVEYIGRGGFSEVWLALDTKDAKTVAIKIQRMDPQWSQSVKANFIRHSGREIEILRSTQHENVVSFYGHFYIGDDTVALVMEYCSGGDLAEMIRKRGRIPEKEAKLILAQVIQGLLALRAKENYVIHYDLKPGNILFNNDGIVKITDFGLSKIREGDESAIELTSQGTGTYYYAAPETFQRGKAVLITPSVDTWSLGIIFYEMLFGQRPFGEDVSQQTFASQIDRMNGKITYPQGIKVSDAAKNFISMCLDRNPSSRPVLEEVAKNGYIQPLLAT
ncbi:Serine/threonine-protein kinase TOUSLED [Histomonas meleagridis]|uniref:Serine/threonine-protein kinase TOUSLED n=1 Tax=Histomonas meleagridis TaxID=135588 RepID=UPI00355A0C8C|nr:Serine/threonine-protein kinase TOUSLED [Histomonas meleagridis]KAH0806084.1 Serine/threonine-protein kinase TOUSLED [Histomonas meleagridis]